MVGVDAADLDILLRHARLQENPPASFRQIDMMTTRHRLLSFRAHELPDAVHRKTGILKHRCNILSDLKTLRTDAGTYSSLKV